jgi:hypothetical protein
MNSLILISPDRGEAFNQFFLVTKESTLATTSTAEPRDFKPYFSVRGDG